MINWWQIVLSLAIYGVLVFMYFRQGKELDRVKKELHMSNFMYSNLLIDHIAQKRKIERIENMFVKSVDEKNYLLVNKKTKEYSIADKYDFDYIVPGLGYYSPNVMKEAEELEQNGYVRREIW